MIPERIFELRKQLRAGNFARQAVHVVYAVRIAETKPQPYLHCIYRVMITRPVV